MEFIDLKAQYRLLQDDINRRIQAVLEHGQYIMGPETAELERKLAAYSGARHCITVASGTEALIIALMAIGVRPGDEVITTPFSFIATTEAIVLLGATPVFVDIESETCNINAGLIEQAITPRTKAIIPVSLYGQPADMAEINALADTYALTVIEDGAQSFGAVYYGAKSCNLSRIGCTSFFPSKPLGCYGDGGAIFTSDDALAQAMREIRVHGQSARYRHSRIGVGGRMDTLQCAIVLAKLERFPYEIEQRASIGARYTELLAEHVEAIRVRPDRTSVYAQYTLVVDDRDDLATLLAEGGIPTAVHYPVPIPLQPAYARICPRPHIPVACEMAGKVLSLPMGPYLSRDEQDLVIDQVLHTVAAVHGSS